MKTESHDLIESMSLLTFSACQLKIETQLLFDLDAHPVSNYYAVTRDGQKIYMASYGLGSTAPFTVTTNWLDLVKK